MILEVIYCKSDIYPDVKINDIVKLALCFKFLDKINILDKKIETTQLEKIGESQYNITFQEFEIEKRIIKNNFYSREINIFKIPFMNSYQYLFGDTNQNHIEQFLQNSDLHNGCFISKVDLIGEIFLSNGISKTFYYDYLTHVDEEPPKPSLAYYLMRHFFIDWKVKSIKEYLSKKNIDNTESKGYEFILELEYVDFIDSYNNILYEQIGETNQKPFYS